MPTDSEREVLAANEAFYAAFNGRDYAAMDGMWARETTCSCVHPGSDPLHGRAAVIDSWRVILKNVGAPRVRALDARAMTMGEVAIVICLERVAARTGHGGTLLTATNVFVREANAWKLAHHHAGPLGPAADELPTRDRTLN